MTSLLPTFFISHGGGPWPWMDGMLDGPYAGLAQSLRRLPEDAGGAPRAILMVSAHWEAPAFTVQSHPRPPMIYDYYGFPEHTYHVEYPAPGDPGLALEVENLIRAAGLPVACDAERGYDHGVYSPMVVAYPDARMPIVQLSLMTGLEPQIHVALGRVLAPLRRAGVLIIGSGLSYHNLRAFGPQARESSSAFDAWLCEAMALPAQARTQALLDWESAPYARQVHPREEHLLPLMVAVGAAEHEPAALSYHETGFRGGVTVSSFRFGAAAVA
ncbi:DODA-type extradiol aromatic ring-opening family dioxygenase [Kerstersia gyiorum]|uniref:Aromatic ring-cleaving dioxygenase n=1 Tax=Kerstersia gyiorum TaxID=206506 RepID=A0A171KS52_9BURK|nr:class III extradiol ring-cleavage dioxygenase [Kerstersia gyiorum]KKO71719.1 aromatic ring-cleaving dioxygenase [Kerstersia gyiorum]MCP1633156.1 aromatic ring-opening dioxygenase catalytic subunit (LigB family) [Kerstersia gyiorum]MCP1636397.1 aromatic ring-opening dioxygenase catalytic subunit (LigB family) [Kerstersia gyiorum]MCP1670350.1 aromatic ring-opening dioxygenase catalytic subunit (LigB family) [Kerstersia gyiorum]MCP1680383.1 aromatic ring-opening dioxygenase catalytic subunit (